MKNISPGRSPVWVCVCVGGGIRRGGKEKGRGRGDGGYHDICWKRNGAGIRLPQVRSSAVPPFEQEVVGGNLREQSEKRPSLLILSALQLQLTHFVPSS